MSVKNFFNNLLKYNETKNYTFSIPLNENNINSTDNITQKTFYKLNENLLHLQSIYNLYINNDIKIRKFKIPYTNQHIPAFLIYIDGMVNDEIITSSILQPLLIKNSFFNNTTKLSKRFFNDSTNYSNLSNLIYSGLLQHNNVLKFNTFNDITEKINSGFCVLFIDNINTAFCIDTKDIKGRSISEPITEYVIRGSQEAFVENLRQNTSLIRKLINNENLIIENISVGKLSKTAVSICYMKNITNDDLVSEVKYRINNIDLDYLLSSGQLEQMIKDNPISSFPQTIATERPDRVCNYLFNGRVAIIVNGSPFVLVVPSVIIDFLSTAEDKNISYVFANFIKVIRLIALFFATFLPGLYVAITNFHQELIPSELLFAIANARDAIPFPVIFEILLMEISFELIREAGLRVASSFSTTIGIIGALILGDAAVSANIVSPILIIVIAFTGICGFAIPDFSLTTSIRIFRFMYIVSGYIAGFLGIAFCFFIHFILISNTSSFGIPYFSPYIPYTDLKENQGITINPIWKLERRNRILNTKRPKLEDKISMKWKKERKI